MENKQTKMRHNSDSNKTNLTRRNKKNVKNNKITIKRNDKNMNLGYVL